MKTLGLMKGNTEDAVREGAHALFYPHGLGHMMGLDLHDMENLGEIWVGYNLSLIHIFVLLQFIIGNIVFCQIVTQRIIVLSLIHILHYQIMKNHH